MSKNRSNKVRKLTDEQYNAYISTLKNEAALYNADGSQFVPEEIDVRGETEDKRGM